MSVSLTPRDATACAFVIEKGIPLPAPDGRHGKSGPRRQLLYPWDRLEVGDSVLVQSEGARASAVRWAARFKVRLISKKTTKGFRIWRAA